MSAEGYPRNEVCAECGRQIVIHISQKGTEYACNSDTRNDFHKPCRNWKAKGGQTQLPQKPNRVSQDLADHADHERPRPGPEADLAQSEKVTPVFHPSQNMPETSQVNEITATVSRKVGENTIAGIPQYENIDFHATLRAEIQPGTDVQQVFEELYAEGNKAIDQQIIETRRKFVSEAIRKP